MSNVHYEAWSAVVRCLYNLNNGVDRTPVKETGIEWAVRSIKALHANSSRVPGLVAELAEANRQRGLAHDQIARLHREVRGMAEAYDGAQEDIDVLEEDTNRANQRIDELKKERDTDHQDANEHKQRLIDTGEGLADELRETQSELGALDMRIVKAQAALAGK